MKQVLTTLLVVIGINLSAKAQQVIKSPDNLKSMELSQLAKGIENAGINATDVYVTLYAVPGLPQVKNHLAYAEKLGGGSDWVDLENVPTEPQTNKDHHSKVFEMTKEIMIADPYAEDDLTGMGHVLQPLNRVLLSKDFLIFFGSASHEESYSNHTVLVVFSTKTKEALVLSVGYSE